MFVCNYCSLIFFSARALFSHKRSCTSEHDIPSHLFNANPNADDDVDCDVSCPIGSNSTLVDMPPAIHQATSTESSQGEFNESSLVART